MAITQAISVFSYLASASVFAVLGWLFADALAIRIEIKTLFKTIACFMITIALALRVIQIFMPLMPGLPLWLESLGLWLLFAAFILDSHTKLQFLAIVALVFLFLFREHSLLAIQASLVAVLVLRLAHVTKHNDLIPFGVGFVLMAVGEFFYTLKKQTMLGNLQTAGDFLYIFASIALFYWLWQYLVIRFNLKPRHNAPASFNQ